MRKVSDILKEEREKQGYSLSDVQRSTKIKREFLLAIEEGKYHDLPSESYARGFIKNYASFLGLSSHKITLFFRREYKEEKRDVLPRFRKNESQFNKRSLLSPINISIAAVFLIVASYIFFQYRSLFIGPNLDIQEPKQNEVISESILEVRGKTDPYAIVFVDGEEARIALDGSFQKTLYVMSGDKTIEVISKNKFGKETRKKITVKVE